MSLLKIALLQSVVHERANEVAPYAGDDEVADTWLKSLNLLARGLREVEREYEQLKSDCSATKRAYMRSGERFCAAQTVPDHHPSHDVLIQHVSRSLAMSLADELLRQGFVKITQTRRPDMMSGVEIRAEVRAVKVPDAPEAQP